MALPNESNKKLEAEPIERISGLDNKHEQIRGAEQHEQVIESNFVLIDESNKSPEEGAASVGSAPAVFVATNPFAIREKKVEQILEAGLKDFYQALPADKKQEFKRTGEKTAHQINLLLNGAKIKIKKVISLIKDWLKIIPGLNIFFLEQEAKIKADEIIKLKDK